MKFTEQDLIKNNYRKFNSSCRSYDYMFQKTIYDENSNKCYFICIEVFDFRKYYGEGESGYRIAYSVKVPFQNSYPYLTINFSIEDDMTIEFIENYVHKVWEFIGKPYYEMAE